MSDDRPPRVLHLLEPVPPDATPGEQLAVAVRRYADLTGRCLCGAQRELTSADAEGRALYVATTPHAADCPAVCTEGTLSDIPRPQSGAHPPPPPPRGPAPPSAPSRMVKGCSRTAP